MIELPHTQGSPEWHAARAGIPTGSEFGRIVTPAKGDFAKGAASYMDELIAEKLGERSDFQGTPDTEHGLRYEGEALRWLAFRHGVATRETSLCLSDCKRYGASPDALTESLEPVEVKCPKIKTFLGWRRDYLETGEVPRCHKVQCHAEMLVTGADRCLFVAYAANEYLDNLLIEVRRDEFTDRVEEHVNTFCTLLEKQAREVLGEFYEEVYA